MIKIYACLAGTWVCLNDDPECTINEWKQSPSQWWEEGAQLYAPITREKGIKYSYCTLDYIHIFYRGKDWRISPSFVQVMAD